MSSWRKLPIDLVALVAITLLIVPLHLHYVKHGLCFDDPSWLFHFGRSVLYGDVPFRDFLYQVGPLPVYVDAGFQSLFGSTYAASLYAAIAITILRTWVVWAIVRRLVSWRAAAAVVVFCALDTAFAVQHHWGTQYSSLFVLLAGLCFLIASRAEGRRALVYFACAGASVALVVTARQSTFIVLAGMIAVSCGVLAYRKELARPQLLAIAGGMAAVLVVFALLLAAQGALGAAIQQMFLDAPAKKGVKGVAAVFDAISGGALVADGMKWWFGFVIYLGVPAAIVAGVLLLGARARPLDPGAVAMLLVPISLVIGLLTRYLQLDWLTDVPRMFLSTLVLVALVSPDRARRWFGLEPILIVGLALLPLGSDWALEMSYPGRGWGDLPSLVMGGLLVALASTRVPARAKAAVCIAIGLTGTMHFWLLVRVRANPFAQPDSADGTLRENKYAADHPILEGMKLHEARTKGLAWLQSQVRPGSTCFVYGNMPVLYDLLGCVNPTVVDTTAGDFITAADAEGVSAILFATPPDFLITNEAAWMNPIIEEDLGDDLTRYGGLNPTASRAIHHGMRAIIGRYRSVGILREILGPDLAPKAAVHRDHLDAIRVYQRVR